MKFLNKNIIKYQLLKTTDTIIKLLISNGLLQEYLV